MYEPVTNFLTNHFAKKKKERKKKKLKPLRTRLFYTSHWTNISIDIFEDYSGTSIKNIYWDINESKNKYMYLFLYPTILQKSSKSSQIRPFNFAPYQINKIVLSRHEFLWYRIHVEGLVLILPGTNLT